MAEQWLKPSRIYYTQTSISGYCRVGDTDIALRDTIADMNNGQNVNLPAIHVVKLDHCWCSLDNRRLYIHKAVHPEERIKCIEVDKKEANGRKKESQDRIAIR